MYRIKVIMLSMTIACAMTMHAQSVPDAPSVARRAQAKPTSIWVRPLKQPEFYLSVGAMASGAIADIHNTHACERNLTCVEAYPGHDRYSFVAPQIAIVAVGTYGCQIMLSDHKWWRRTVCSSIGVAWGLAHWKDATTIYHESPVARP